MTSINNLVGSPVEPLFRLSPSTEVMRGAISRCAHETSLIFSINVFKNIPAVIDPPYLPLDILLISALSDLR